MMVNACYPRGNGVGVDMPERGEILEIGKGRIIHEGTDVAIEALAPVLPRRKKLRKR